MISSDPLRRAWESRACCSPIYDTPTMTADGLVLGAGTVLAKGTLDDGYAPGLARDGAQERILALLSVAYGRAASPAALGNIRRVRITPDIPIPPASASGSH